MPPCHNSALKNSCDDVSASDDLIAEWRHTPPPNSRVLALCTRIWRSIYRKGITAYSFCFTVFWAIQGSLPLSLSPFHPLSVFWFETSSFFLFFLPLWERLRCRRQVKPSSFVQISVSRQPDWGLCLTIPSDSFRYWVVDDSPLERTDSRFRGDSSTDMSSDNVIQLYRTSRDSAWPWSWIHWLWQLHESQENFFNPNRTSDHISLWYLFLQGLS